MAGARILTIGVVVAALVAASGVPAALRSDASGARRGGTLRVDLTSDFDYVDPSLAYFTSSWQLQHTTQLKLLGFPDRDGAAGRTLRPEAAASFPKVSRDGRTYTFTIRRGFKFNDGSNVTAANFRAAILRVKNPAMRSPGKRHLSDVRSVTTPSPYTLRFKLRSPAPDFITRMSMPFFSAIPLNRPIAPDGVGAPLVSAGPYYVRSWDKGKSAVAVRNPYWDNSKGPWNRLARPASPDQIIWTMGQAPANSHARIQQNQTDIGTASNFFVQSYITQFGINQQRFFVKPTNVVVGASLNTSRPLFANNVALRQAVNSAIDRPRIAALFGTLGATPTDQILPPGFPGFRDADIYPLIQTPESIARAQSLARGNTRDGKAVFYTFNSAPGPQIADIVKFNLKQIGIDVEVKQFPGAEYDRRIATRGEPFDISHSGWGADYPDPYDFINVLLDGRRIQATNNVNESYFNNPAYNRKMDQASRLSGAARLRAYGNLDIDIMRNQAPLVPYFNTNARIFVSPNVGCFTFNSVISSTNLVATCKQ